MGNGNIKFGNSNSEKTKKNISNTNVINVREFTEKKLRSRMKFQIQEILTFPISYNEFQQSDDCFTVGDFVGFVSKWCKVISVIYPDNTSNECEFLVRLNSDIKIHTQNDNFEETQNRCFRIFSNGISSHIENNGNLTFNCKSPIVVQIFGNPTDKCVVGENMIIKFNPDFFFESMCCPRGVFIKNLMFDAHIKKYGYETMDMYKDLKTENIYFLTLEQKFKWLDLYMDVLGNLIVEKGITADPLSKSDYFGNVLVSIYSVDRYPFQIFDLQY